MKCVEIYSQITIMKKEFQIFFELFNLQLNAKTEKREHDDLKEHFQLKKLIK